MGRKVFVVGVGMTKFEKPGAKDWDYPDMAMEAGTQALQDAGIPYEEVEQAAVGYVYGESTCGQRAVYGLGLTGIPVYNVNNNCSTGSTALFMAKQLVEGGIADCVLDHEGGSLPLSVAIGAAAIERDDTPEAVLARADAAMYVKKAAA